MYKCPCYGKAYQFEYNGKTRIGRLRHIWPKSNVFCARKSNTLWPIYVRSVNTLTFSTTEGFRNFYDAGITNFEPYPWWKIVWMYLFGSAREYHNLNQKV